MGAQSSSHKIKIAAVSVGILALVVYLGMVFFTKKEDGTTRKAPVEIIQFEGLEGTSNFRAEITIRGKTSDVPVTGNHLVLTPEQQIGFALPYHLKFSYQDKGGSYRDLSWRVDDRGVEYNILASGFSPDNRITLIMNGQRVYTVPLDWSGRIELPVMLIISNDTKACIEIQETGNKTKFCHQITGKKVS